MTMVKELISNRNENYTFFIQCSCGQEILQFYYYKYTNVDDEIIALRYFGHIDNHKDSKCANFTFTRRDFNELILALNKCLSEDHFGKLIQDKEEILAIRKDKLGFYTLLKFRDKKQKEKENFIWDICLSQKQVLKLIEKLNEMRDYIYGDVAER